MMRKLLLIICFLASMFDTFGSVNSKAPAFKIGFIPNKGQYQSDINYCYKGTNMTVELGKNGFSYVLIEKEKNTSGVEESDFRFNCHKLTIELLGSNTEPELLASEAGEGELIFHDKVNIERSYQTGHFRKVLYKEVYPNIDIEFLIAPTTSGGNYFKYNFILHPGANSDLIKLKINGSDGVKLGADGSLQMKLGKGELEEQIPVSYEQNEDGSRGNAVSVKYRKIGSNLYGLMVGKHQKHQTVVVDPIAWCTYFGGESTEFSSGIQYDLSGNIYITGRTSSASGVATSGAHQTTYGGNALTDTYLAKYSSSGTLIWATYLGGDGQDNVNDLEIDKFNNIVISGSTNSASGIATTGAFQSAIGGDYDGFISKFSPSGAIVWSTYLGFSGSETFLGIAIDKDADIYVTGYTNSTTTLSPLAYQPANAGNMDAFLAKVSAAGTASFATYYGGIGSDYGSDVVVDQNKNIYYIGYSNSTANITTSGTFKPTNSGNMDAVVAKFDSTGKRVYATYYGGTVNDYLDDLLLDPEGNLIMTGYTNSTTNIYYAGGYQNGFGGGTWDGFVLKMDTSFNPKWASYMGGSSNDFTYSVCIDASSNIYVTGGTASIDSIATVGAEQTVNGGGGYDGFITKIGKNGNRINGTYFGSLGSDHVRICAIDAAGELLIAGETTSSSSIATSGAQQKTLNGISDSYICKYVPASPSGINNNSIQSDQGLCLGKTAQVLSGNAPSGGNGTFTYLWLMSNTGLAGSFTTASGTNNTSTYAPGALVSNRYYRRVVYSGAFTDTSNMVSIVVSTSLEAGFTVNKTIQCLKNNQFIFADTTTNSSGTLAYAWDFGNGKTSSNQIDTITYDASVDNLFKVRLVTTLNGGCADTNYRSVILINNPQAKTVIGPDTVMKGTTSTFNTTYTNGSSYIWSFGKGTGNSSTISINIKWTDIGDDTVKMLERNGGGCYGDTVYKLVYIKQPTGSEEFGLNQGISVYPNPGEGIFTIDNGVEGELKAEVFTFSGQSVYKGTGNQNLLIDLTLEPAGIYHLHITNEQGLSLHRKIQIIK